MNGQSIPAALHSISFVIVAHPLIKVWSELSPSNKSLIEQEKCLIIPGYNVTAMRRENVILIRVDDYVYKRVEEIVEESKDLGMTKSECGYTILKAFFKVNKPPKDLEKTRELTIKMRKGLL